MMHPINRHTKKTSFSFSVINATKRHLELSQGLLQIRGMYQFNFALALSVTSDLELMIAPLG